MTYEYTKYYLFPDSLGSNNTVWNNIYPVLNNEVTWLTANFGARSRIRTGFSRWSYSDRVASRGLIRHYVFTRREDYTLFVLVHDNS